MQPHKDVNDDDDASDFQVTNAFLNDAAPCPFCGSIDVCSSLVTSAYKCYETIDCQHCGASAPAKAWNKRVNNRKKN